MMVNREFYQELNAELKEKSVTLVAVTKLKPVSDIQALYEAGHREFGENYVQELVEKQSQLPGDVRWHFIGHLQSNKVKYIAPFVHLIQAVDSYRLLEEINKQAKKNDRIIDCLLQMHIAAEETKFGLNETDLVEFMDFYNNNKSEMQHVRIRGIMGMASFVDDECVIRSEFQRLKHVFKYLKSGDFLAEHYFDTLSMGMTDDYAIAVEEGSTLVRIGRALFGKRP